MNPWAFALVVLVAVLVGVTVPVLIQLRATLRSAQRFLDTIGPKIERTLDELTATTGRLNRVVAEMEGGVEKARGIVDTAAAVGQALQKVRGSLGTVTTLGMAVGPAVAAAVRAIVFPRRSGPSEGAAAAGENEAQGRVHETASQESRP